MISEQISEQTEKKLKEIIAQYPDPKSTVIAALYLVQEEKGYLSNEAMLWVAEKLDLPAVRVKEVATFYSMFRQQAVGKYHIQLCRTLSCMVTGSKALLEKIKTRLKLRPHEVSADGMWSYEEVECLGSCGSGPAMLINDTLFEHLTPEKLNNIINRIEAEQPDLSYSTLKETLGQGLK
ncbi:MAG: NADH-quinone oxidoreductase subunit NuoE [Deltaproteobacteria bacterium]|jgi:NADH-quinone oxidoreductase subunit E|nr:NADH-quinone oxidoreductase subunit NuoE [Deltaproteobacteria bacterium]